MIIVWIESNCASTKAVNTTYDTMQRETHASSSRVYISRHMVSRLSDMCSDGKSLFSSLYFCHMVSRPSDFVFEWQILEGM